MDDRQLLDASRLTAEDGVDEGKADLITNESNRMIAGGMFRQARLSREEGGGEDHESKVKSTCVNISPVLHQSTRTRVPCTDAAQASGAGVATSQRRTCNHHPVGTSCCNCHQRGEQRLQLQLRSETQNEKAKETPVARMLRYLESLPPDLSIRKELREFSFWKSLRTEFIATVVFVLISLGVGIKNSSAPYDSLTELSSGVATGLITCILMYMTSNQIENYKSCHLNPCLTLALMISRHHDSRHRRRVSPVRFLCFAAAQLLASITASCILAGLVFNHESLATDSVRNNSSFSLVSALPQPVRGINESNVFGFEFLAAFLVTITYFAVTDGRKVRKESSQLFAESKIQSSGRRKRIRMTATSHGNETRGSGNEEGKSEGKGNLLPPSHETCDSGRHLRKRCITDPFPDGQSRRKLHKKWPKEDKNCSEDYIRESGNPGREPNHPPNMMAHVASVSSPGCSPSSSSSHSHSCCTQVSTSPSGSCSLSSSKMPLMKQQSYGSPCWGRFEYVGFAVITAHLFAYKFTGASVNTVRIFGPALLTNKWTNHWVYWVASLLGSIFAAFTYEYIKSSKPEAGSLQHQVHDAPTSSTDSHSASGDIILSPSGISFTPVAKASARPFADSSSAASSSSPSPSESSDQEGEGSNNGVAACRNVRSAAIMDADGKPNDVPDNGKISRGEIDGRDPHWIPSSCRRKRSQEKASVGSVLPSSSSFDHLREGGSEKPTRGPESNSREQRHAITTSATIFSGSQMRVTQKPEDSTEMTFISPVTEFSRLPQNE